jgi:hypothetical protein
MVEWELMGETEVFSENLLHCHILIWDQTRAAVVEVSNLLPS